MRIIDLKLNIDGLILKDDETVEGFIDKIQRVSNTSYEISYEVLYEEGGDSE